MYSSKFWHYVQPEWWQKRVKNIHQFLYSPQIHFLPLSLQTLYAFANRTLVTQFLTSSREHWLGVQGGQSARVWLMESSVVFCVQNVLPFSLCGQKMRSAPWLASTRPPDGVSLTPVESLNNPLGPTHWGDEDNMENNHKKNEVRGPSCDLPAGAHFLGFRILYP